MYIRYPRTYKLLKRVGFSPMKADEIILEAHRKGRNSLAMSFIRIAFGGRNIKGEK